MSSSSQAMSAQATKFGKVAVLFGGQSAEREVSLLSGQAVLDGLRRGGVDAHGVDVSRDVIGELIRDDYQRAFVILHGRGGEDGTIQGALDIAGVPYTGSGVLGCALAMDKHRTKKMFAAYGLPTPRARIIAAEDELHEVGDVLGFPLMIKPVHEGSSIGMAKVTDDEELLSAWWQAARYDAEVMAEQWVQGPEYTAGIVADEVYPIIRVETPHAIYDYHAKYADDAGTQYHIPSGLDADQERGFQNMCLEAFHCVAGTGWGRVDFMCDEAGKPWLLEVNTAPGMTSHSLVPMAAAAVGLNFDALVWRILETTLEG